MKRVLIFAPFPQESNIKDGKIQRINAIDFELKDCKRVYVEVSLRRYFWGKEYGIVDENKEYYRINFFSSFFLLVRLLKSASNIYIHSLYNYVHLSLFSLHDKNVIVDLHGAVPEERQFMGNTLLAIVLGVIEKRMFSICNYFICVSEEMKQYYIEKYPKTKNTQYIIKPIYSSNAMVKADLIEIEKIKNEMNIKDDDIIFIYSGNLQKWQNIDLMLNTIKKCQAPNHFYIFLTGDENNLRKKISSCRIPHLRYVVSCVSPNELSQYYELANYGFILRDEHVLNRVAAPTKLVEYLYFGIIPIVKYERIGDSYRLGYEYISCESDLGNVPRKKSVKNKEVAQRLLNDNSSNCVDNLIR